MSDQLDGLSTARRKALFLYVHRTLERVREYEGNAFLMGILKTEFRISRSLLTSAERLYLDGVCLGLGYSAIMEARGEHGRVKRSAD